MQHCKHHVFSPQSLTTIPQLVLCYATACRHTQAGAHHLAMALARATNGMSSSESELSKPPSANATSCTQHAGDHIGLLLTCCRREALQFITACRLPASKHQSRRHLPRQHVLCMDEHAWWHRNSSLTFFRLLGGAGFFSADWLAGAAFFPVCAFFARLASGASSSSSSSLESPLLGHDTAIQIPNVQQYMAKLVVRARKHDV